MAQRSKKLTIAGLRNSAPFLGAKVSGVASSDIFGATIGVVGMTSASRSAKPRVHGAGEARPRLRHVDIVGGRNAAGAFDARPHIGVDLRSARLEQLTMDRQRFRRREAALGIHRRHVVEQRDGLVGKPHPGCPEPAERVRKSCADRLVETCQGHPLEHTQP